MTRRLRTTLATLGVVATLAAGLTIAQSSPAGAIVQFQHLSCDEERETPFTDVEESSYAYVPVACIYDLGITEGVSLTEYGPDQFVTRRQMAAFLARFFEALEFECPDLPAPEDYPFDDVESDSYAYAPVWCIFAEGLTEGVGPRMYGPDRLVTRAEMATFIARLVIGYEACDLPDIPFTDVPDGHFAAVPIQCLFDIEVTEGVNETTFGLDDPVSRRQMAAFLARTFWHLIEPCCGS